RGVGVDRRGAVRVGEPDHAPRQQHLTTRCRVGEVRARSSTGSTCEQGHEDRADGGQAALHRITTAAAMNAPMVASPNRPATAAVTMTFGRGGQGTAGGVGTSLPSRRV